MHQGDRFKAQNCKVCKTWPFSKWQWNLFAINGITSWIKVQKYGSKLCQLSKHLIKECGTSLGPVQHELASIDWFATLFFMKWLGQKVRNCQLHLFDSPYSKMILRSSWTFWKVCNVLYNSSLKWILRYLLELGEELPWSWVQNLPKLGQNFTSYLVHEHVFTNYILRSKHI